MPSVIVYRLAPTFRQFEWVYLKSSFKVAIFLLKSSRTFSIAQLPKMAQCAADGHLGRERRFSWIGTLHNGWAPPCRNLYRQNRCAPKKLHLLGGPTKVPDPSQVSHLKHSGDSPLEPSAPRQCVLRMAFHQPMGKCWPTPTTTTIFWLMGMIAVSCKNIIYIMQVMIWCNDGCYFCLRLVMMFSINQYSCGDSS